MWLIDLVLKCFHWEQPPAAEIQDYLDVLDGTGDHAAHKRVQEGFYVQCSCGTRAKGRMENV